MQREPPQTPPEEIAEIFRGELTRRQKFDRYWRSLWLVEVWTEYRPLFKHFAADLGFSALLQAGLELFHWWATKSSALETQVLVKLHFIGTVIVFAIFGGSFIVDIIKFQRNRWKTEGRPKE